MTAEFLKAGIDVGQVRKINQEPDIYKLTCSKYALVTSYDEPYWGVIPIQVYGTGVDARCGGMPGRIELTEDEVLRNTTEWRDLNELLAVNE